MLDTRGLVKLRSFNDCVEFRRKGIEYVHRRIIVVFFPLISFLYLCVREWGKEGEVTAQLWVFVLVWVVNWYNKYHARGHKNGNKYEMGRNAAHFVKASRPLQVQLCLAPIRQGVEWSLIVSLLRPYFYLLLRLPFFPFSYSSVHIGIFVSYRFVAWLRAITCRYPRQRLKRLHQIV